MPGQVIAAGIQSAEAKKAAKKARQFAKMMSNTAWRRSVHDLKAAGLNPMLAYGKGPASSPSVSAAQVPDFGGMAGTATKNYLTAVRQKQELKNLVATESLTDAQTAKEVEQTRVNKNTADLGAPKAAAFESFMDMIGSPILNAIRSSFTSKDESYNAPDGYNKRDK